MTRVLVIRGGTGILGVHMFFILLHFMFPHTTAYDASMDEEGKSLWHVIAESLMLLNADDRDRFMDLCLKRRVHCNSTLFQGPSAPFHWKPGITEGKKDRFWHSYRCAYKRDLNQCPVDGHWSSWSPWNACTATCDAEGYQNRTRTCSNPVPLRGGERCHGSLLRARPCLGPCKMLPSGGNGGLEGAEEFLKEVHAAYPFLRSVCYNTHCIYGTVKRILVDKSIRAKYWSSLSCVKFGGACPQDGKWGQWSAWSQCSLQCGSGSRIRGRFCDSPKPAFGGHPCAGEFQEQQSCIMRNCGGASTETFTEWTHWTPCSVSCGSYGVQSATRVCLRHVGCDLRGVLTPYINRSKPCHPGDCPSKGGWSEWSDWTECSAACGTGRRSRMRLCDSPFPTGGLNCLGESLDFRLCKGSNCSGHSLAPAHHGIHKKGSNETGVALGTNDEYANGPLNPSMEALYTPWTSWTECTETCGQGTRKRTRGCSSLTSPLPPCEGEIRQTQFCNVYVCPVPGGWGVWLPWTPCSETCGRGTRQRYRQCNNPLPQFGGTCGGDAMRVKHCDMGTCPRLTGGTWSRWSAWSSCTVSCGGGQRSRSRSRRRYSIVLHTNASAPAGSLATAKDVNETLDCNIQPCPVNGHWAEWGQWARCSAQCGLGRKARDRTCTDPAPTFKGEPCHGPGTDVTHCFAGPCKDIEDRAVRLDTQSWIRFAPRNRPARFLTIYLHFKPLAPSGLLLRRYRKCRSIFDESEDEKGNKNVDKADRDNNERDRKADQDDKCRMLVELKFVQGLVHLLVLARGARLEIHSSVILSLGAWHELLVEVLKTGASLRVNDHPRLHANLSRQLVKDLDFDSYMTIGASDNKTAGLKCSVCSLSINFQAQDLFAAIDWDGQGTPVGRHAVSEESINPSVQLPHFRGLYYFPLRLYDRQRLDMRLTMALDKGEGLLLFVRGQGEGTLLTLGFKRTRLVLCIVCSRGANDTCHQGDLLTLRQWYHITLHVEAKEAELRVDQGKALQLACKGLPFRPRGALFVGGRSSYMWNEIQRISGYQEGFFGVLGTMVVNGRTISFRKAVLMGRDNRINLDGYSRASRITPVFEHKNSIVTLHCEIDPLVNLSVEVKVIWLLSDSVLESSEFIGIVKPVGKYKRVGSLQLLPGGNTEGIYSCVISRDGRLELFHVYPVFRHSADQGNDDGDIEWLLLELLLILLLLLSICCGLFRFKRRFITLWRKRFRKKRLEKQPLLFVGQMRSGKSNRACQYDTDDTETSQDSSLAEDKNTTQKAKALTLNGKSPYAIPKTLADQSADQPTTALEPALSNGRPDPNRKPSVTWKVNLNGVHAHSQIPELKTNNSGILSSIPSRLRSETQRPSYEETDGRKPVVSVSMPLSLQTKPNAEEQTWSGGVGTKMTHDEAQDFPPNGTLSPQLDANGTQQTFDSADNVSCSNPNCCNNDPRNIDSTRPRRFLSMSHSMLHEPHSAATYHRARHVSLPEDPRVLRKLCAGRGLQTGTALCTKHV